MSNSKSIKKTAAKTKTAPAVETYDADKDRRALRELVARRGRPDDDHRAAFHELIDDDGRAELGGKTRAAGVFREGVAWAVQIDEALSKYPALAKEHYAPERFVYFLDRLVVLDEARAAQAGRREGQGVTRATAAERETAARAARQALLSRMRRFAGQRKAERDALAEATGRADDTTALGDSIAALVKLAREWLAREGTAARIQRQAAGLTDTVIDAALAAAEALTGAATEATLAGRRSGVDAPEVNLAEGSVLHEMAEAMRCFDEAHEATKVLPRLAPGAATRNVLGAHRSTKKSEKPAKEAGSAGPG